MNQEKNNLKFEIGKADDLLSEGRLRAQREQIPFMQALKIVVTKRLIEAKGAMPESKHTKDGEGHVG
jgi:hypothetical protein